MLAFAGTDLFSKEDWKNNGQQGTGILTSDQHKQALQLTSKLQNQYGDNLSLTGHSLGGGLAIYAASKTGLSATTFNAAGLHKWNTGKYTDNITAIVLSGDILNIAQDASKLMPDVVGNRKDIGNSFANSYAKANWVYGALRHGAFNKMRKILRDE